MQIASNLLSAFFKLNRLVLLILLVLFSVESFAQQQIILKHFSLNNGLINDEIDHIYFDCEGFVWLGSATGLQLYDGYNFKEYQFNTDDSTLISDNFSTIITEDEVRSIWIGTFSNGLEMYDKKQMSFITLKMPTKIQDSEDIFTLYFAAYNKVFYVIVDVRK